jgi:hypothetical protein
MNQTVLIGKVVGKYELPHLNIHAIELECGESEFIIHMSKDMYDTIDLSKAPLMGVKGHLYYFNGDLYVYADKLSIVGM